MLRPSFKMGSPSTAVSTEAEGIPHESVPPADANLPGNNGNRSELEVDDEKNEKNDDGDRDGGGDKKEDEDEDEDEDEEEDVDFNPFLKDTPSREASSSLSSEIEGLDADVVDSGVNTFVALVTRSRAKPSYCPVGDTEHCEEIVTQATPSSDGACSTGVENFSPARIEEGKCVSTSQPENGALHEKIPIINTDDEDAICKRTRARYSLASFTLDELETFLQETDDEDDIHNVDDEEEYRKFLAAVLLGGGGDSQNQQGKENVDDEDDDNDADFELEIEEALESDLDENTKDGIHVQEYEAVGRRHKTRRNRCQKSSIEHSKQLVALSNRPLRPLLPYVPIRNLSAFDGRSLMPKQVSQCPTPVNDGLINGFTPHQIGQLHCLIHEHVQLLIQVFSICALDPVRRHIASEVQKMMLEVLRNRDQVLAWRRVPHPSICFFPPYVHPTVPEEHLITLPSQLPSTLDAKRDDCSSAGNMTRPSENNIVPPNGVEGTSWAPYISGPILSVLDVAPLGLAGKYMDDVAAAARERQRIEVGDATDTRFEREPLFPLSNRLPSSSGSDHMPKKTMAAALVEKVKKQSVVPVPKEISKLALRFYPLFNPALYPHKPPPAPVANRVLFTDSEDELLAMGLMEFNTDWKAIQQRFLPCKSKHQIFVRQKNRSSSKAPENPIKAVRRMKSSPLTSQEIARIEEGLKIFKLDWISVWKFIVPYRDPSLLPRQWRIATGTQKSYKSDETKKAKRRLYDARRRMGKTAALAGWHTSSEKEDHSADDAGEGNNSGDYHTDREDEAYVHEAFLADWRPVISSIPHPVSDQGGETNSTHAPCHEGSQVSVQMNLSGSRGAQAPAAFRSSSLQPSLRPYRARRANNAHLVKLAPDLPPVNLPPSVRIMSQSAFKNYQAGASQTSLGTDCRIGIPATEAEVLKAASASQSGVNDPTKAGRLRGNKAKTCTSYQYPQDSGVAKDKSVMEENDESGLQMHPLLFQTPEAGHVPYYPLNCNTSVSTSFSFFSGSQPQLNLSLFHNFRRASHTVNLLDKSLKPNEMISSSGIDFHPLLQRNNGVNSEPMNTHSVAQVCANSESLRGRYAQIQNPIDATLTKSCINTSPSPTSAKPSSPYDKSNELDLDIHLSFTSRKQKAVGSRDVTQHRMATSAEIVPDSRLVRPQNIETLSNQNKEHKLTACTPDGISNKLDSGAHALLLFSNGETRSNVDNIGDQSLPGIVMEQEELSDSEDDNGENVEFECEEMADSEGEEASDSEQNLDLQNEAEKISLETGMDDEHCEPSTHDDIEGNSCSPEEGQAVEMRLMDKGIDRVPNSTCLNLNSCPPASPPMKRKYAAIRHSSGSGGKTPSNKTTKSTKPSMAQTTVQNHVVDMSEQSLNSSGKSRKRTCRAEGSSLSKGRSRKGDSNLIADTDVQSSKHVNKDEHG